MIGLEGICAQDLSDLVGAIHGCALDAQCWSATCRKIAYRCASTACEMCVHGLRQVHNDPLFIGGYQPEFLKKLERRYAQSSMAAADSVSTVGGVSALFMTHFDGCESRFFQQLLEPFRLQDMCGFPALQTGGRMACIHASRSQKEPHFQRRGVLAPFAASLAVFMQDPVPVPCLPGEAFARLHGRTGGELRVRLALSQGLGGMQAANLPGIGEPTVRNHLQHRFSKTGTSRQAELLRLLHNSPPPMQSLQAIH